MIQDLIKTGKMSVEDVVAFTTSALSGHGTAIWADPDEQVHVFLSSIHAMF
jgi:hypothetical protein